MGDYIVEVAEDEYDEAVFELVQLVHQADAFPPGNVSSVELLRIARPARMAGARVALLDGLVVGYVAVRSAKSHRHARTWMEVTGAPEEALAVIDSVLVHPDHRRQGLARRLIVSCRPIGYPLVCDTVDSRIDLGPFLRGLGFGRVGQSKAALGTGQWTDCLLWAESVGPSE